MNQVNGSTYLEASLVENREKRYLVDLVEMRATSNEAELDIEEKLYILDCDTNLHLVDYLDKNE